MFRGQEPGPAANRSVSAADVVLYGVNLILPLMSQDLLKVSEERNVKLKPHMLELEGSRYFRHEYTSDLIKGASTYSSVKCVWK